MIDKPDKDLLIEYVSKKEIEEIQERLADMNLTYKVFSTDARGD